MAIVTVLIIETDMAIVTVLVIETDMAIVTLRAIETDMAIVTVLVIETKKPSYFQSKRMGASALIIPPSTPDNYVCLSLLLYQ